MTRLKYFRKILEAQERTRKEPPGPLPVFDIGPFLTRTRIGQWVDRFFFRTVIPKGTALLRATWPNLQIGRLVLITRDEDVRAVLADTKNFAVPFGLEMTELAGGTNSVLGLEGREHDRLRSAIRSVMKPQDLDHIRKWSRRYSQSMIAASGGTLDVITDLVTRVATETCCRYFGISVNDPVAFAHWTIAVSNLLFADPTGDPKKRALALNGAARVRFVLEDAVARVHENDRQHPSSNREHVTLVDRLINEANLNDGEVVATLMGLATGFIPTNTLAAGNMLEELLARPTMMEEAKRAARKGDEPALRRTLLQAARLNPALSPGQWRYATRDSVIAGGTWREKKVRKGSIVLASIASALRDGDSASAGPAHPERAADLVFGWGEHSCLGRWVAMEQIVQTFMVLLAQPNLSVSAGRHGWMQRMSVYPIRLDMTFDSMTSKQSMIIVSAPVADGAKREAIEKEIDALGNPARLDVARTLKDTGIVHFASLSVIDGDAKGEGRPILLVEINSDGPQDAALERIAGRCLDWMGPIMRHCRTDGTAPRTWRELAALLREHALDLHCYPWGPIGIHYNGTPEFSVSDIQRQQRLASFARRALSHYYHANIARRGRAMEALTRVRRFAKQDSFYQLKANWGGLLFRSRAFQYSLVRPSRKRLALAQWQPPASKLDPLKNFFRSPDGIRIVSALGISALVAAAGIGFLLDPPWLPGTAGPAALAHAAGIVLLSLVGGFALTMLLALAVIGALASILRLQERKDEVDERAPDFAHMKRLAAREDAPGYEQNHIIAVMPLKPGRFRKLVFAFALWGIKQSVKFWFRPGFVVTMGTIHYAKWFRVPGTQQFVFLSNYDGNWESYLEDFITRAHWGQTAAWSNGQGFPRTRFLIFEGAKDGDRFKRWVRRQQQVSRFWYSRFPELTTRQIRNNAIIEDGLANAVSDTDARRWLACFGSAQREEHEIETSEVQSIAFSGFGNMHHASCIVLKLPDTPERRLLWLKALIGAGFRSSELDALDAFGTLARLFEAESPRRRRSRRLLRPLQIAFGDHPVSDGTAILGFSSTGLQRLGLAAPEAQGGLAGFPAAFNFGMAGRGRILGDLSDAAADRWIWSDGAESSGAAAADAVLIVYGQLKMKKPDGGSAPEHQHLVGLQTALLEALGGEVLHIVPTGPLAGPAGPTLDLEHFGFRDGISQPVIRGTQRAAKAPHGRDLVEPGEFLLGYLNNQRFYPPLISVPEETDQRNDLPVLNPGPRGRFPTFGSGAAGTQARDLGRNGSFLVIRQLDQDVEGFKRATERHASEIREAYYGLESAVGHRIDEEWIAAKMVGRWRDGTPLVGSSTRPRGTEGHPDNDFAYGVDDPRGYQCPFSAHIRRANPRDSLEPGDATEQFITNRHRLLRRGRSYAYDPGDGTLHKGLLFMALCADLERQFEFVQHTWINSSSFHGLTKEPDPIAGRIADSESTAARTYSFTIPTALGPVVLDDVGSYTRVRAGGYFFMPSLAALKYLCSLAAGPAERSGDEWKLRIKLALPRHPPSPTPITAGEALP
ncbi:MAG: Dyp-type peroxidase [Pseudomonadota bacterium]|nr:Dyp-type peroxidase [Pseudomonadota bacterium]